jgi:hypothetical protein
VAPPRWNGSRLNQRGSRPHLEQRGQRGGLGRLGLQRRRRGERGEEEQVRRVRARSSASPFCRWTSIARDPVAELRLGLAHGPAAELRLGLARDPAPELRLVLARDPAPEQALRRRCEDSAPSSCPTPTPADGGERPTAGRSETGRLQFQFPNL